MTGIIRMIKRADWKDAAVLAGLAIQMWEDNAPADLAEDFRELLKKDDAVELSYLAWI